MVKAKVAGSKVLLKKTSQFNKISKGCSLKLVRDEGKLLVWPKVFKGSKFNHLICMWWHHWWHHWMNSTTSTKHWILNTFPRFSFIFFHFFKFFSEFMNTTMNKAVPTYDLFRVFWLFYPLRNNRKSVKSLSIRSWFWLQRLRGQELVFISVSLIFLFSQYLTRSVPLRHIDLFPEGSLAKTAAWNIKVRGLKQTGSHWPSPVWRFIQFIQIFQGRHMNSGFNSNKTLAVVSGNTVWCRGPFNPFSSVWWLLQPAFSVGLVSIKRSRNSFTISPSQKTNRCVNETIFVGIPAVFNYSIWAGTKQNTNVTLLSLLVTTFKPNWGQNSQCSYMWAIGSD